MPFSRPVRTGSELSRIVEVLDAPTGGGRRFGRRCEELLQGMLDRPALLVTSATHALEMAAVLLGIGAGDEVIVPAYTISSTANAFLLRGAKPVFADVDRSGNIDPAEVARLLSRRTRAVVPVHYGGHSCDMDHLRTVAGSIPLIEDAAQAIGAAFRGTPLGTFGACGAISFHETKNIGCGEGGALVFGDPSLVDRADQIREKGTDRRRFELGLVGRYTWVDVGSSYTLSELNAAWLSAQLEELPRIQSRRQWIWDFYAKELEAPVERAGGYVVRGRKDGSPNGHLFAFVFRSGAQRNHFIGQMGEKGISCRFHFTALHTSPMGRKLHDGRALPQSERLSECLVRLPLYFQMSDGDVDRVVTTAVEVLRTV
ncbi:MAG: dTDP-4-amino-4,6-dideoxygalactose transaminase [Deltaproteobacteria bacterium]|nr:MAG: dTDP-4-amino-4,6-dideoxygalactose transaminase [Deltaproteobacteria bacterium]